MLGGATPELERVSFGGLLRGIDVRVGRLPAAACVRESVAELPFEIAAVVVGDARERQGPPPQRGRALEGERVDGLRGGRGRELRCAPRVARLAEVGEERLGIGIAGRDERESYSLVQPLARGRIQAADDRLANAIVVRLDVVAVGRAHRSHETPRAQDRERRHLALPLELRRARGDRACDRLPRDGDDLEHPARVVG